jgi:TatD-related deoxyribonuclease
MATVNSCSHGFFLETDYMDDLRRPGAVLGPKTVPKRTKQLLDAGLDEKYLWKAHQELAEELYGPSIS